MACVLLTELWYNEFWHAGEKQSKRVGFDQSRSTSSPVSLTRHLFPSPRHGFQHLYPDVHCRVLASVGVEILFCVDRDHIIHKIHGGSFGVAAHLP